MSHTMTNLNSLIGKKIVDIEVQSNEYDEQESIVIKLTDGYVLRATSQAFIEVEFEEDEEGNQVPMAVSSSGLEFQINGVEVDPFA